MPTVLSSLRLFFAIDLPDAIKDECERLQHTLQEKHLKTCRWIKPHNMHITLHFLAKVAKEDVTLLVENIYPLLQDVGEFTIELGALELFPTRYKPRVISFNVMMSEQLKKLHERIGAGVCAVNYAIEQRPFRPHVSLAHLRNPNKIPAISAATLQQSSFTADKVILFESRGGPEGSNYIPLASFLLSSKDNQVE